MNVTTRFLLLLPHLLRSWGASVLFMLVLRWCALTSQLFDFDIEVWDIVLPSLTALVTSFYFVLTGTKLFRFSKMGKLNSTDIRVYLCLLITLLNAFSASFFQQALFEYTSKDRTVSTAAEIKWDDGIRYYKVQHPIVAGYFGSSSFYSHVIGRHNETLVLKSFFIAPLVGDSVTKKLQRWNVWLGYPFEKSISNRESEVTKRKAVVAFQEDNIDHLNTMDLGYATYYEKLSNGDDRDLYIAAIERKIGKLNPLRYKELVILEGRLDAIVYHTRSTLGWGFTCLLINLLIGFLLLIKSKLIQTEYELQQQGQTSAKDPLRDQLLYLVPGGNHRVTSVYLLLLLSGWILSLLSGLNGMYPSNREMIDTGALTLKGIKDGEYWRILTALFAVGHVITLILFTTVLIWLSYLLEKHTTALGYALTLFFSGTIGCLHEVFFGDSLVVIGAGYIVMGLAGCLGALMLQKRIRFASQNLMGVLSILASFVFAMLLSPNVYGVLLSGCIGLAMGFVPDVQKDIPEAPTDEF